MCKILNSLTLSPHIERVFNPECTAYGRYFLKDLESKRFKDHKLKMLNKMEKYLASTGCRRK